MAARATRATGQPSKRSTKPRIIRSPDKGNQKFGFLGSTQVTADSDGRPRCSQSARGRGPVIRLSMRLVRKKNSLSGSPAGIDGFFLLRVTPKCLVRMAVSVTAYAPIGPTGPLSLGQIKIKPSDSPRQISKLLLRYIENPGAIG